MALTKSQGTIIGISVTCLIALLIYIASTRVPVVEQPETIRGPSGGPFITLPDNIVQNRIDIWRLDINDAGILTIDMNLTLDDGFYYVKAEVPVKGNRLKFKDYKRILEQEVKADGAD